MYISEELKLTTKRCGIDRIKNTRMTSASDNNGEVRVFEGKAPERGKLPLPTRRRVRFTGLLDIFSSL